MLKYVVALAGEVKEKMQAAHNQEHVLSLVSGFASPGAQVQHRKAGISSYSLLTGFGH